MEQRKLSLATLMVMSSLAATQAHADVLYDGGSASLANAYTISAGNSVSDVFDLSAASTLTGVTFSNWLFNGATASKVDWSITSLPFGGSTLASGTATLSSSPVKLVTTGIYSIYSESQ